MAKDFLIVQISLWFCKSYIIYLDFCHLMNWTSYHLTPLSLSRQYNLLVPLVKYYKMFWHLRVCFITVSSCYTCMLFNVWASKQEFQGSPNYLLNQVAAFKASTSSLYSEKNAQEAKTRGGMRIRVIMQCIIIQLIISSSQRLVV